MKGYVLACPPCGQSFFIIIFSENTMQFICAACRTAIEMKQAEIEAK
jgi:DNA-directed RNA polymerase subunit RPC12/RpoP